MGHRPLESHELNRLKLCKGLEQCLPNTFTVVGCCGCQMHHGSCSRIVGESAAHAVLLDYGNMPDKKGLPYECRKLVSDWSIGSMGNLQSNVHINVRVEIKLAGDPQAGYGPVWATRQRVDRLPETVDIGDRRGNKRAHLYKSEVEALNQGFTFLDGLSSKPDRT